MFTDTFWAVLIVVVFFHTVATIVIFIDTVGLILKIFPVKIPPDYIEELSFRNSDIYKKHRRKWIKRYSGLIVANALLYFVNYLIIKDVLISITIAVLVSACVSYSFSAKESRERKDLKRIFFVSHKG